jgi:hypothetical protein
MAFAWSYSAYKEFDQCARKYHLIKIEKMYKPDQNAPALVYGRKLHKEIENYLLHGEPLGEIASPYEKHVTRLKNVTGQLIVEKKMGLTKAFEPCDFFGKNVWWRGAPDILILDEDKGVARVLDWKTNKNANYADPDQLELMAMAIFSYYPKIHTVKGVLLFLKVDEAVPKTFTRGQLNDIKSKWMGRVGRITKAIDTDVWNPTQGPLCKFCPVSNKDCEYAP